jgi:cytochrome c oxidase subunit 2
VEARDVGRQSGRYVRLSLLAVLVALATAGCSRADLEDKLRFGWPRGITDQAREMRVLWTWASVAALAVGVMVWGLIFWVVIVYRRRDDDIPKQTKYNLPIEIVYTVLPVLIVSVLFYYTAVIQNSVTKVDANPDTTITVVGFQWNWEFDYNDQRDPQTNEFLYTIGTATEIPILVIPAGQKVKFIERSNDVVHSFWVPEFLFKRDVFPGTQVNTFEITANQKGAYVGRCAELCGTYHSEMNFEVRVVSPDDYRRYLGALQQYGNTDPDRQSKALTAIGQPPEATTTYPFDTARANRAPSERPQAVQGGTR